MHKLWLHHNQCLCKAISLFSTGTSRGASRRMESICEVKSKKIEPIFLQEISHILKENDLILEFQPGKGILSRKLIEETNNRLIMFQPSKKLRNSITTEYLEKLNKKIVFTDFSLLRFYKYTFESSENHVLFMKLIDKNAHGSSDIKIIGSLNNLKFCHHLLCSRAFKLSLYENYCPSLLLFVSYDIFSSIFKQNESKISWRLGIVFNLFFEVNHLATVPKSYFTCSTNKRKRHDKIKNDDHKKFFLVSIIPRKSIVSSSSNLKIDDSELKHFFFFVNYFIRTPKTQMFVFAIEDFIPGFGKDLIKAGFNFFDCAFDFTRDQWISSFLLFHSHPKFNQSNFSNFSNEHFEKFTRQFIFEEQLHSELNKEHLISETDFLQDTNDIDEDDNQ